MRISIGAYAVGTKPCYRLRQDIDRSGLLLVAILRIWAKNHALIHLHSSFPGPILHSRAYRRASDYLGKSVLVIGRGNSASDIVRHLAQANASYYRSDGTPVNPEVKAPYGFTRIYQSASSSEPNGGYNTEGDWWMPHVQKLGLIQRVVNEPSASTSNGTGTSSPFSGNTSQDGSPKDQAEAPWATVIDDQGKEASVQVLIFATGYYNSLPFAKITDSPWDKVQVLDEVIERQDREGGEEWEVGGLRGMRMGGLDDLLLFVNEDRSIAFPGLSKSLYQQLFSHRSEVFHE